MIIAYKVVKLAGGHFCSKIFKFAHRDESDSNRSETRALPVTTKWNILLCCQFCVLGGPKLCGAALVIDVSGTRVLFLTNDVNPVEQLSKLMICHRASLTRKIQGQRNQ